MGVPKFFRWLSERYPLSVQRYGSPVSMETYREHFGKKDDEEKLFVPNYIAVPDPLSTCGLLPPHVDRLYIDMNGLIHCCSHNNLPVSPSNDDNKDNDNNASSAIVTNMSSSSSSSSPSFLPSDCSEVEKFTALCYYLDRIVRDVAKPQELLFLAIDGVAPRAKLNQQRARRYRSSKEGEIESTVYDAHLQQLKQQQQQQNDKLSKNKTLTTEPKQHPVDDDNQNWVDSFLDFRNFSNGNESNQRTSSDFVKEVEPGRFTGKFETRQDFSDGSDSTAPSPTPIRGDVAATLHAGDADYDGDPLQFHSNNITPGTAFFQRCTEYLEHFIQHKISTDPAWQKLNVIFSGYNVPGEGEHKIMQFIREQQSKNDYNPNLRHCIMGQDGDLIMLGLATHEPNLILLRERVVFSSKLRQKMENDAQKYGLGLYLHNANYELLHMNVLRDYLAFEFGTSNVLPGSPYELESTIDDFVFLTFLVGNDFLPALPALDIADNAFDLLFSIYRAQRKDWIRDKKNFPPYLTHAGKIVCGNRLETFLQGVGSYESGYYSFKESATDLDEVRRLEAKFGRQSTPDDEILESKEASDRSKYRQLVAKGAQTIKRDEDGFVPAMSTSLNFSDSPEETQPDDKDDDDDWNKQDERGLLSRISNILHLSIGSDSKQEQKRQDNGQDASLEGTVMASGFNDKDFKGRYYADKFGFSPFDKENHLKLRKAYLEGLVWTLAYYYHKVVSWEWFYPYHYSPMISDLTKLDKLVKEIEFSNPGGPLLPFQQLLACMPPSQANLLPKPYRALMTDQDSPLIEYYPKSFVVDMNGKRWPWEAVVLLPFINSAKLIEATALIDPQLLTEEERQRNVEKEGLVFYHDKTQPPRELPSLPTGGADERPGNFFGKVGECSTVVEVLSKSKWFHEPRQEQKTPSFVPMLRPGVLTPLDGLPTLRDGSVRGMKRRPLRLNVHGTTSRYTTAVLEIRQVLPEIIPIELLAKALIGTSVYINYPFLIEAFVTAISNSRISIRGKEGRPKTWTVEEAAERRADLERIFRSYRDGAMLTGTGGISVPGLVKERDGESKVTAEVLLSVRPLRGIRKLEDGTVGKIFSKFEMQVPLFVTSWKPVNEDKRLSNLPLLLEQDPFHVTAGQVLSTKNTIARRTHFVNNSVRNQPSESTEKQRKAIIGASSRGFATCLSQPLTERQLPPVITRAANISVSRRKQSVNKVVSLMKPAPRATKAFAVGILAAAWLLSGNSVAASIFPSNTHANAKLSGVESSSFDINPIAGASQPRIPQQQHQSRNNPVASNVDIDMSGPIFTINTPPLVFAHGTTTLAFLYQGGIVVAVDSRATLGSFIGSKTVQKVIPIHRKLLGTMAGGAADCSFWIRKLASQAALYEALQDGKRMSVARASRILSNLLYANRGLGLSMGTMIMGYDNDDDEEDLHSEAHPRLFYVDDRGTRIEGDMFAVGSGSTYALAVLGEHSLHSLSREEAIQLGVQAIRYATLRDGSSGGYINVYHLGPEDEEWTRVFRQDVAAIVTGRDRL